MHGLKSMGFSDAQIGRLIGTSLLHTWLLMPPHTTSNDESYLHSLTHSTCPDRDAGVRASSLSFPSHVLPTLSASVGFVLWQQQT